MSTPDAAGFTRATFAVEDRVRGLQLVADKPLPAGSAARRRLPSAEEIIADTIREETGGRPAVLAGWAGRGRPG